MSEQRNFVPIWEQWQAEKEANLRSTPPNLPPWQCRHCVTPLIIEAVGPSCDGERILTFWHCDSCETAGVTPASLQDPPERLTEEHVCTLFPERAERPAIAAPFPTVEPQNAAEKWLLEQLADDPQRIMDLYHTWTPSPDSTDQATLAVKQAELTAAAKSLGMESFFEEMPSYRGRMEEQAFWRLPAHSPATAATPAQQDEQTENAAEDEQMPIAAL